MAEQLKAEGKQKLEASKSSAAKQVEQVANALKNAGSELDRNHSTFAVFANQLASSIGSFGTRLREGSIEDLASDVQRAARRNPALFITGGFAVGVILARVLKASAVEREPRLVSGELDADDSRDYSRRSNNTHRREARAPEAPTVDITKENYTTTSRPLGG